MYGMNSQYFAADPSDLSLASDILLREEPEDEEENDEKDNDEEDDDGDEGYSEWVRAWERWRIKREYFVKVVEETLDSLPQEFRSRIQNVAVLVEDLPPNQPSSQPGKQRRLLLGIFHGVPTTKKSVFDLWADPIISSSTKEIEAACCSEAEAREQIRLTVIHELGHYFGMDEEQLKDV
jgi:predicted Zn-dependent protease with MMP-like domain